MRKHIINIFLFIIIIYTLAITNVILPKDLNVIASENRNLHEKPNFSYEKLFSGEYFKEYDNYFADNFIFRKSFISISNNIKKIKGINSEESVEIVIYEGLNVADDFQSQEISEYEQNYTIDNEVDNFQSKDILDQNMIEKKKEELKEEEPVEELIAGTKFGKILIVDNVAMEINTYNEEAIKNYASAINYISENVDKNVITYSLLIPTQIEFIKKDQFKDISFSQKESISFVNSMFNSIVKPVNVYDELSKHSDEYIYFKTDHHWTSLGAYYTYSEFIKFTGEEPLQLNEYEKIEIEDFLGTLYNITLSEKLANNPDTIEVYTSDIEHKYFVCKGENDVLIGKAVDVNYVVNENKYSVFLQNDKPLSKITTENENDKRILIIKDSYANAFIPYLIPHYKEIYIIDPRTYDVNIFDFVENKQIDEILFINYVLVNRYDGYSKLFKKISGVSN